jgi:hypothetical protein
VASAVGFAPPASALFAKQGVACMADNMTEQHKISDIFLFFNILTPKLQIWVAKSHILLAKQQGCYYIPRLM